MLHLELAASKQWQGMEQGACLVTQGQDDMYLLLSTLLCEE
jgi:hypothetical protein